MYKLYEVMKSWLVGWYYARVEIDYERGVL